LFRIYKKIRLWCRCREYCVVQVFDAYLNGGRRFYRCPFSYVCASLTHSALSYKCPYHPSPSWPHKSLPFGGAGYYDPGDPSLYYSNQFASDPKNLPGWKTWLGPTRSTRRVRSGRVGSGHSGRRPMPRSIMDQ